jgi:hypothetical protein
MLKLRHIMFGFILLAMGSVIALSGCSWAVEASNGHWNKHEDGTRTCDPGGTDCVCVKVTGKKG